MRPITRKAVVAIAVILVLLVALGALPGLLKSGDPYYVTAEPVDATVTDGNATAVDATNLSERTYRYTWEALAAAGADGNGTTSGDGAVNGDGATDDETSVDSDGSTSAGRSGPYWKGPVGFKEAFTHSPFDELDALRTRYSSAMIGEREALVRHGNQTYRLALVHP